MTARVIFVDGTGCAQVGGHRAMRAAAEREARALLLSAAMPPAACGPEMPVAPGRGPTVAFTPREMVQTEAGGFVRRHAGYMGRDAARVADAFDLMTEAARKAHAGRARDCAPFVPPFTPGQVQAGRDYAALVERCAGSGVRCSSLETRRGGGSDGCREDAMLSDMARLRMLDRRIGDGLARDVRRPSRSGTRSAIRVRDLVRRVCVGGQCLSDVLRAYGWSPKGPARAALLAALCAALDRMQGFDLARPQNVA